MLHELRQAAESHHLTLSGEEVLRNGAIGLDGIERKLIYLDKSTHEGELVILDLDEVESCSINATYRNIDAGDLEFKNVEDFIESITLRFTHTGSNKQVEIPFYDCNGNYIFELETMRGKAHTWKRIVSQLLDTKLENRA